MNCIMCNKENAEVKINDKIAMCQKCSDQETEDMERIDEFIIKGHSDHCACRLVWGDGECECHLRKEKTMNWKQFLTEKVLRECWHERVGDMLNMCSACSCGKPDHLGTANDHINRTFDTDADMMALFRVSYKNGEWKDLEEHLFNYWDDMFPHQKTATGTFTAWLFCLDGKGYEDRCCLVAQWLEVKK